MKLLLYPYIIVRIRCALCMHDKNYRLARLSARFGVDIEMDDLLVRLTHDCSLRHEPRKRSRIPRLRCQACFIDLRNPRPPDVPPASQGLHVIQGGRDGDAA